MDIQTFSTEWGGRTLTIETGRLAHQANGSVIVRYGDTVVMATATMSKSAREGLNFFPLMVDYEEKYYAAGKIKGSRFIKKEGRPSDEAVLTSRMIDRGLRPLFDERVRNDIQVIANVLSFDGENDSDVVANIAAAAALHVSDIPWNGPIGAIRIGRVDGEFVVNPTYEQRELGDMDIVIAGTTERLLMVEAEAKIAQDDDVVDSIAFGLQNMKPVMDLLEEMRAKAGREKVDPIVPETDEERTVREHVEAVVLPFIQKGIEERFFGDPLARKIDRAVAQSDLKSALIAYMTEQGIEEAHQSIGKDLIYSELYRVVSDEILKNDRRVDGRGIDEIRALFAEVGLLPRTHGSAHFMRGETQILSTTTLAGPEMAQIVDTMEHDIKKRYMHHYSFPPFSVGETKPLRGPGRREIGHGALAEKALEPVLPTVDEFPYVIRTVSETMGSNGSSSMGSTCGSSLALMSAGVPIKEHVAGVAVGLASVPDMSEWKTFTDLQDLEDGPGGMDFKITGTKSGVTAVQLDTKTIGLTMDIVKEAFERARVGRLQILDVMNAAISEPAEMSEYAPRLESFVVKQEKIGAIIGPGGKMINEIIDKTGVAIDIDDDGRVTVTSTDINGIAEAVQWIKSLVEEPEVGKTYKGKVTRLMDFGAFIEFLPKQEGLVHVSEMAPFRLGMPGDLLKEGQEVMVKLVAIDDQKRNNLSMKQAEGNEKLYENPPKPSERPPRPDRSSDDRRGGNRGLRPPRRPRP